MLITKIFEKGLTLTELWPLEKWSKFSTILKVSKKCQIEKQILTLKFNVNANKCTINEQQGHFKRDK